MRKYLIPTLAVVTICATFALADKEIRDDLKVFGWAKIAGLIFDDIDGDTHQWEIDEDAAGDLSIEHNGSAIAVLPQDGVPVAGNDLVTKQYLDAASAAVETATVTFVATNGNVVGAGSKFLRLPNGASWASVSDTNSAQYTQDNSGSNVPAALVDPTTPASPIIGDATLQSYDDGQVFSVFDGTAWTNTLLEQTGGWTATDYSGATESIIASGENHYRNLNTSATTWNLTVGTRGIFSIENDSSAGVLTLNTVSFRPTNETATTPTLTVQPGESLILTRETGGALRVLGRHEISSSAPVGTFAFKNVVDIPSGTVASTFTPVTDGNYIFDYSIETASSNSGISIGTSAGASNVFSSGGTVGPNGRISNAQPSAKTGALALTGGTTYHVTQWNGGGGSSTGHTVCAAEQELHEYIGSVSLEAAAGGSGIPSNEVNAATAAQTITLPDSTTSLGEAYKIVDATNGVTVTTATGEDVLGDVDHIKTGDLLFFVPSRKTIPGELVLVADQPDGAANTVTWTVSPNVTLRRGNNGGLYNPAAGQGSWSGGNATGTLWRNDTFTTPTSFSDAYDQAIGDNITDPAYDNAYITDTATGTEYGPFTFTRWQAGGGGGFAVSDQTTTPDTYEPAWELVDPRPEVRLENGTSARQVELSGVSTVLNVAGDFTPGQGGNTGLSLTKFDNGSGGQSYVGLNTDQDFFFNPVLMSRISVRSWNDVATGNCDMRLTLYASGIAIESVTQTLSQPGGGGSTTTNFDFAPATADQVKLEILSNRWRALGMSHQLEAPVVPGGGNTFASGGYQGAHDVLHLVNPDDTLPLFVDGVNGITELSPQSATTIIRINGQWYSTSEELADANYRHWVQSGPLNLNSAGDAATLVSVTADGGATVTAGGTTHTLTDGQSALFVRSAVTGWNRVGESTEHVADAQTLFGTVDADALLADMAEGQAFHFQAATGGASLTTTFDDGSGPEFGVSLNGDLTAGNASPLAIPAGTQGYMSRAADGRITVTYVTTPGSGFTFTATNPQIAGISTNAIPGFASPDAFLSANEANSVTFFTDGTEDYATLLAVVSGTTGVAQALIGEAAFTVISDNADLIPAGSYAVSKAGATILRLKQIGEDDENLTALTLELRDAWTQFGQASPVVQENINGRPATVLEDPNAGGASYYRLQNSEAFQHSGGTPDPNQICYISFARNHPDINGTILIRHQGGSADFWIDPQAGTVTPNDPNIIFHRIDLTKEKIGVAFQVNSTGWSSRRIFPCAGVPGGGVTVTGSQTGKAFLLEWIPDYSLADRVTTESTLATAAATLNQLTGENTWVVTTNTDPGTGEIHLTECEYHQIGKRRIYNVVFRIDTDDPFTFEVPGGQILTAAMTGGYSIGGTAFEAPGNQFRKHAGENFITINRDDDNNADNQISGTFEVWMQ